MSGGPGKFASDHRITAELTAVASRAENLKAYDPFADVGDEDTDVGIGSGVTKQEFEGKKGSGIVHVRVQQRNGRKTLTTIQGIDEKKFSLKNILKHFKKEYSCNGTLIEDDDLGRVIQLQGDHRAKVAPFLLELGISKESIKLHGA
ncbi:uncharacterized protein L969DRAFT_17428 [Mixia osmundae IAM 14324]|uniref:uncharacterized protein n=1 Tax=Mixia osmundae (strain CBS 9802 / IAM 14324 / JCM 22182 / KY 12970) TaxID=764103 RepID=UPI0004A55343|nr:uncharacterized protein L969DRAFT_17428 [Mixia osmundae IAM 14324]KEI39505.1 hypothetical protein L969DRAFT_17428 [Mixia osmundae IAM 14324]